MSANAAKMIRVQASASAGATITAAAPILLGKASVLYTFYPPMIAHWTFYAGAALLLVGSIPWLVITIAMTANRYRSPRTGRLRS